MTSQAICIQMVACALLSLTPPPTLATGLVEGERGRNEPPGSGAPGSEGKFGVDSPCSSTFCGSLLLSAPAKVLPLTHPLLSLSHLVPLWLYYSSHLERPSSFSPAVTRLACPSKPGHLEEFWQVFTPCSLPLELYWNLCHLWTRADFISKDMLRCKWQKTEARKLCKWKGKIIHSYNQEDQRQRLTTFRHSWIQGLK